MSLHTLADVLSDAKANNYALAGLVVLGWDDAVAFVEAAEQERTSVILQAGPGFRKHMPLSISGPMFQHLAELASVPVVTHLDHGATPEECQIALDYGFSSVMFDGSRLPLSENTRLTAQVVEQARHYNASVEGEIGYVGYSGAADSAETEPEEAAAFARETCLDAMAISIGNVHLQTEKAAEIDFERLQAIEALTGIPLVLHGGSGIPDPVRRKLAATSNVCKFNVGTEIRMAYGQSLKQTLSAEPELFDRIGISKKVHPGLVSAARQVLRSLRHPNDRNHAGA